MTPDPAVLDACRRVLEVVAHDPRFARTSALRVVVDGRVVVDERLRGPVVTDGFSVTKTVVSTLVGIALDRGEVRLDDPLGAVLDLEGLPAERHTWRQVLSMTRGAAVGGPWDEDAVAALPDGWVDRIAAAPQVTPPGEAFAYDSPATHLVAAALDRVVPGGLRSYADRALFAPLGIADWRWDPDPAGVPFGAAHLHLTVAGLSALGELWLGRGTRAWQQLVPPAWVDAMATPVTAGGPPEQRAYGLGAWVEPDGSWFAGGWGGQHVLVLPAARAVVVTTGDTGFVPGPPPTDELPPDWRPALDLVRAHLVPALRS